MEHNSKIKKAFWITEDMDREIDAHLKQDNCSSRSEFVMNALKFYVGFLNTKNASAFLPEVLSATLTGTLDGFAGRISSLLFKQGVDINLMAQIIAYDITSSPWAEQKAMIRRTAFWNRVLRILSESS